MSVLMEFETDPELFEVESDLPTSSQTPVQLIHTIQCSEKVAVLARVPQKASDPDAQTLGEVTDSVVTVSEVSLPADGILGVIAELGITLRRGVLKNGQAYALVELTGHREKMFDRVCERRGIDINILAIYPPADNQSHSLTQEQREALRIAHANGYFEVPRGIALDELADELNVSSSAVSQRLRRATQKLVEQRFNG